MPPDPPPPPPQQGSGFARAFTVRTQVHRCLEISLQPLAKFSHVCSLTPLYCWWCLRFLQHSSCCMQWQYQAVSGWCKAGNELGQSDYEYYGLIAGHTPQVAFFVFAHLDILFHPFSFTGSPYTLFNHYHAHHSFVYLFVCLASVALGSLVERCRTVLLCFNEEERLSGNCPLPR